MKLFRRHRKQRKPLRNLEVKKAITEEFGKAKKKIEPVKK